MDEAMQSYVQGLLNLRKKEQEIRKTKEEQLAREKEQDKTLWLAYHDTLTGLYNRSGLEKCCEEIGYEKEGYDRERLTVLVLDVNDLKIVNDRYGHSMGDRLICHVADTLQSVMLTENVFRIGGDEFLVILEDLSDDEIKNRLQVFQETVRDADPQIPIKVVVSCGAARGQPELSFADLQKEADQRMYVSKRKLKENVPKMAVDRSREERYRQDGLGESVLYCFVLLAVLVFLSLL